MEQEQETQKTVEQIAQEDFEKLLERQVLINERVAKLDLKHEHLVIIHRYEGLGVLTFLEQTETMIGERRRQSWYGRVIAVSKVDSGDDIIEKKKRDLIINSVVNFNPDSAWSLNIAGFEEIWCLHIDNIIVCDNEYNYIEYKKENMRKRLEAKAAVAKMQWQKAQVEHQMKQIQHKQLQDIKK